MLPSPITQTMPALLENDQTLTCNREPFIRDASLPALWYFPAEPVDIFHIGGAYYISSGYGWGNGTRSIYWIDSRRTVCQNFSLPAVKTSASWNSTIIEYHAILP